MKAGTRTIRTRVASASTASVSPSPSIRMKEMCAGISAAKEIDITRAAAVTTRPMPARPRVVLVSMAARASAGVRGGEAALAAIRYSCIREIRKIS
nr:hypothetical protein CPGR_05774 [Mycolicibacter nonchromogenicus]